MEVAGSGYLYTLAVIATTFAGFATITMIFRQVYGGHVTKLDSFVTRTFIQVGLIATLGALLSPLLAQFELAAATTWRASSALLAVLLGIWSYSFPHRRDKSQRPRYHFLSGPSWWCWTGPSSRSSAARCRCCRDMSAPSIPSPPP